MAILTASELGAIRSLGELGMVTEVTITRSSNVPVDPLAVGYDPSTDYGDDQMSVFTPVSGALQPIGVTSAWFLTTPLASSADTGQGMLTTISHHIIRMPIGTDVKPQDVLVASDTGSEYLVIDTNADDTWPEWLDATVTRRE